MKAANEWVGWIKAVLMQEGDLPTVAKCCELAELIGKPLAGYVETDRVAAEAKGYRAGLARAREAVATLAMRWADEREAAVLSACRAAIDAAIRDADEKEKED